MIRILKITTMREFTSDQEWEDYKVTYDSHPSTHRIDWQELENNGETIDSQHYQGEIVETVYRLTPTKQDNKRKITNNSNNRRT